MHVLIIGAAGMIGRKLAGAIAASGTLGAMGVDRLTLADAITPQAPAGYSGEVACLAGDISDPATALQLIAGRPDVIVHLAAIVSGEAEQDFDKGYRINLDGTRHLFDAIRHLSQTDGYCPRLVFASSIAVFGAPMPDEIDDTFVAAPPDQLRHPEGDWRAVAAGLLAPRIFSTGWRSGCRPSAFAPVCPTRRRRAFFSGILREPLSGKEAVLPVPDTVRHWHASPRAAVGFLTHAATMDLGPVGHRRVLNMPGLSATVAEQIEALRRIAGDSAVALIRHEPDPAIMRIVSTWPRGFAAERALGLGFRAENSFDEIIRIHIEDEMDGSL